MEFGNAGNMIRIVATATVFHSTCKLHCTVADVFNVFKVDPMHLPNNSRSDFLTFQCNGTAWPLLSSRVPLIRSQVYLEENKVKLPKR